MAKVDDNAEEYDRLAADYAWYGNDIVFGLTYEYTKKGETLLDLGIGTGLSSIRFSQAGLKIYGCDRSDEMLAVCKKKGFAEELKILDINKMSYENNSFDHVICIGVLHFFKDIGNIIDECYRILRKNGTFSFTVEDNEGEISERIDKDSGGKVHSHGEIYIKRLVDKHNFELLKKQRFLAVNNPEHDEGYYHTAYVLRK